MKILIILMILIIDVLVVNRILDVLGIIAREYEENNKGGE